MSTLGSSLSNDAATQPLLPRPYAAGLQNGSMSATDDDCGSLHEIESGSPSTLRYANVLSLTARSRWPGHGLLVCAAGYARPNARSSRSAASLLARVLAIASASARTVPARPFGAASSAPMPKPPTLDDLRRYAVARTLFKPTTLARAIDKLGFVQADPIRAPARAQDLILRHRVAGYRAGDLERRYPRLAIEEDAFVNYGFLPRRHLALMHPRTPRHAWDAATRRKAAEILEFIRSHGPTHPRVVEEHFAHGRRINAWGGSSQATTHLLDGMHYRGLLRVRRREAGTRIYEAVEHPAADDSPAARVARAEALLALVVAKYAPLP